MELSTSAGPLAATHWPGEGPLVVLLHSGVTDRRSWSDVAPHLGAEVLAYDRRGFGEVAPGPEGRTHLDDLLEVLAGRGRPAWLVGNSRGGGLALDAALAAPDAVAGLVLVGTAVSGIDHPDLAGHDLEDPQADALEQRASAGALEERVRAHQHLWLDGPREPEGRVGGAPRELLAEMLRTVVGNDLPEEAGETPGAAFPRLGEVRVPTTVAVGALDEKVCLAVAAVVAQRVPGARHVVLPGTAHLPSLDAPQRVVDLVRGALEAG